MTGQPRGWGHRGSRAMKSSVLVAAEGVEHQEGSSRCCAAGWVSTRARLGHRHRPEVGRSGHEPAPPCGNARRTGYRRGMRGWGSCPSACSSVRGRWCKVWPAHSRQAGPRGRHGGRLARLVPQGGSGERVRRCPPRVREALLRGLFTRVDASQMKMHVVGCRENRAGSEASGSAAAM